MTANIRTIAVGITGGIGSGKTAAAKIFESLGAKVYYADPIAKDLMNSDSAVRQRIERAFGKQIYQPDGTLNRKEMAKTIFNDTGAQKTLEKIVHPVVLDYLSQEIAAAKKSGEKPIVMVEAALIFEAGAEEMFDYVLVVEAESEVRIARIVERDNASRADVLGRINAQLPGTEKRQRADFVIQNTGDRASLEQKCRFFFTLLMQLTRKPD